MFETAGCRLLHRQGELRCHVLSHIVTCGKGPHMVVGILWHHCIREIIEYAQDTAIAVVKAEIVTVGIAVDAGKVEYQGPVLLVVYHLVDFPALSASATGQIAEGIVFKVPGQGYFQLRNLRSSVQRFIGNDKFYLVCTRPVFLKCGVHRFVNGIFIVFESGPLDKFQIYGCAASHVDDNLCLTDLIKVGVSLQGNQCHGISVEAFFPQGYACHPGGKILYGFDGCGSNLAKDHFFSVVLVDYGKAEVVSPVPSGFKFL